MPSYWPSDPRKIPDLLDFFIFSGISRQTISISNSYDLSSDHTPVIVSVSSAVKTKPKITKLFSKGTNPELFRQILDKNINLKITLKCPSDIDNAIKILNEAIINAANLSTKTYNRIYNNIKFQISTQTRILIKEKRKLRKIWQTSKCPKDKKQFNKACEKLKSHLINLKNENTANYLQNLKPNSNENSLWNAVKYLKRPTKRNIPIRDSNNDWCRSDSSKAKNFATHLAKIFATHTSDNSTEENRILQFVDTPCPMELPLKPIKYYEVATEVKKLKSGKAPGHDLIDAEKAVTFLTYIFYAILRLSYCPLQWKIAKIIMKPIKHFVQNI